ncbi:MAG: DUF1805 domain-containing protein [Planctomycetaceae bacterium]|nr:DUF1805 domain-containing protein [Planctomycetaceae bacterium]
MNLDDFQTTRHELNRPLLVISGSRGALTCGYVSLDALNKLGDAAAIVRGVADFDDMLTAEVQDVSEAATALGVNVGMTGQQALELFR